MTSSTVLDTLWHTALVLSTVGIGLSSLGEANELRKVSLKNSGEATKLGNFSPMLFGVYFSTNVSWWVYAETVNDRYISIACGVNAIAFLYYLMTIINVLNRPLIVYQEADSMEANMGHPSNRSTIRGVDGEEGSLRAIFRAFDYQIDEMNAADRDRIYERRKAESLFFVVVSFWMFYGALLDAMGLNDAAKLETIAIISSIHAAMVSLSHLKTIQEMVKFRDSSKFSVPMQAAIIINLSLWTLWSMDKRFVVTLTMCMSLGISLVKFAVWGYLKINPLSRKEQAGGSTAPPALPALTITTTDEMGNVTQERRLSFTVPFMDTSSRGAEDHSVMANTKNSIDGEGKERMDIETSSSAYARSSSPSVSASSGISAHGAATLYESIPENAVATSPLDDPLPGEDSMMPASEGIYKAAASDQYWMKEEKGEDSMMSASEGIYKAAASDQYWMKEEKEGPADKEDHDSADSAAAAAASSPRVHSDASTSTISPDEWVIPSLPPELLTKEGAVIEQRQQQLEQRVPFS